jgi:hypothetical protein
MLVELNTSINKYIQKLLVFFSVDIIQKPPFIPTGELAKSLRQK